MTVQEMYDCSIKPLPPAERLRLAQLILNDMPANAVVDSSAEWSEDDLRDFNRASWEHIDAEVKEPGNG